MQSLLFDPALEEGGSLDGFVDHRHRQNFLLFDHIRNYAILCDWQYRGYFISIRSLLNCPCLNRCIFHTQLFLCKRNAI